MNESVDFKEFNEAMAKFQGEYEPPKKDKKVDYTTNKGQRIKYDYADLESLQKAIRSTSSKYGLSWNVDFDYKETKITSYGKEQQALILICNVIVNHSSGAFKTFKGVPLYSTSTDPQSIGSIKTYAERYALSAAFGIASDDDDDGQIATDEDENQKQNAQKQADADRKKEQNEFYQHKKEVEERIREISKATNKPYKELLDFAINKSNEKLNANYNNINSKNIGQMVGQIKIMEIALKQREGANK